MSIKQQRYEHSADEFGGYSVVRYGLRMDRVV